MRLALRPQEFYPEERYGPGVADALFRIGTAWGYLEVERSLLRVEQKAKQYDEAFRGGAWQGRFTSFPLVLLWTEEPERARRLVERSAKEPVVWLYSANDVVEHLRKG